ncbi:UbiX family flavin prenyltransferase [Ammonifex thiophilus]|uniref:Flavin prenyltransferase UbiX n=1 Tax=Ammonifex thiophilus TaxID=444093 RepID=A0A3D8P721_9THEO|nr:UbiX family flavin prenyltransferase [Ammonifex thiophilus]RDV84348.1 UbiX family flavin prenyltransferase [Ammonifex thiophilus]
MRLVVALTGASGIYLGVRFLEVLKEHKVETYLLLSRQAEDLIWEETGISPEKVRELADFAYNEGDWKAPVASGSFLHQGMVVIPCSMKTLAGIAQGYAENLILRAADVTLKERRPLILVPRETPLSALHLENMLKLARLGVIIAPPVPAFYHRPRSIEEMVDFFLGRILNLLGIPNRLNRPWPHSSGL